MSEAPGIVIVREGRVDPGDQALPNHRKAVVVGAFGNAAQDLLAQREKCGIELELAFELVGQ